MADQPKSQIIQPPAPLSGKVREGGPGAVDAARLARADRVVEAMADEYLETVKEDLVRLSVAFSQAGNSSEDRKSGLEAVFEVAHNIKGQGGSFGYGLMTVVANNLCLYLDSLDGEAADRQMDVIGLHIAVLQLVIRQGMKGEGGEIGQQLVDGLQKVAAKISAA